MIAVQSNHQDIVKLLLKNKADPNLQDNSENTALMYAVRSAQTKNIIQLLMDNQADIDKIDINGKTTLMLAVERGNADVVKMLTGSNLLKKVLKKDKKANVDIQDNIQWTAWMIAVAQGRSDIVQLLLKAKADVNFKNSNGQTALMLACITKKS